MKKHAPLLPSSSSTEVTGSMTSSTDVKSKQQLKKEDLWKCASIFLFILLTTSVSIILLLLSHRDVCTNEYHTSLIESQPKIFIITPTYARPERLADLTMLAQVLMHVKNIHWVVVEDGGRIAEPVERLLHRTEIEHTYFSAVTPDYLPKRGWAQRNAALRHLREKYIAYTDHALVYFADDDNSYDYRVFDDYIRKVKRLGVWAVGLAASSRIEAPNVDNDTVIGWNVMYRPHRRYAVDMAGFAVSLRLILGTLALFGKDCVGSDPEDCFLRQIGVPLSELEPFGHDTDPKDVLVWHTKTVVSKMKGESYGYVFEEKHL